MLQFVDHWISDSAGYEPTIVSGSLTAGCKTLDVFEKTHVCALVYIIAHIGGIEP